MAQETITRIVEVQVDKSITTVKELKQRISELRDKLVEADESSEEWKDTASQLRAEQERLNKVMGASKKDADAVAGSYDALVKEMSALKKEWRATGDAIERAKIGDKIKGINDQLKEMDASIGNYQRNVGSYEEALKNWTPTLKSALEGLGRVSPAIGAVTGAVDSLDKAMQLMSVNPVGAWLMGIVAAVQLAVKAFKMFADDTDSLADSIAGLDDQFKQMDDDINFDIRIAEASGKSVEEINKIRLANAQLQQDMAYEVAQRAKNDQANMGWWDSIFNKARFQKNTDDALAKLDEARKKVKAIMQDIEVQTVKSQHESASKSASASGSSASNGDRDKIAGIYDSIFLSQMSDESREVEELSRKFQEKIDLFRKYGEDTAILEQMREEQLAEIRQKYREKEKDEWSKQFAEDLRDLEAQSAKEIAIEQALEKQKEQIDNLERARNKAKLQQTGNFLNAMSGLAGQSSVAGKSLAVASALISTYTSAQQAYQAAFLPIPTFSSPIIGALNMATAIASGMANVRQILAVDAENGESGASISGYSSVQAPAVIQQSPVTRTITEGMDEDTINALQSTQRVVLVYSDVEAAGTRVKVQNNESSF